MRIGELAERLGSSVQTIRYYESQGLLPPPERSSNNYRTYSQVHYRRLAFILRCRSLDMSHEEIQTLLLLQDEPSKPCDEVNTLLDRHLAHVEARMAALAALKSELEGIRRACSGGLCVGDCGALDVLRNTTGATESHPSHIAGVHR